MLFFLVVIGFSLGACAGSFSAAGFAAAGFCLLVAAAFGAAFARTGGRALLVACVFMLAASLGAARAALVPRGLPTAFAPLIGTHATLPGIIAADPDVRETGQRVTVEVSYEGARTRVLAAAPPYPPLSYGVPVAVTGAFELPEPFDGEAGRVFRYDRFLAKDGIFALVQRAHVETAGPRAGFLRRARGLLYDAKHGFGAALSRALPEPEAGLASGILTGGKQGLGKELLAAFTIAGLVQIVVLSGYNVTIIAEGIARLLAFLPRRVALACSGAGIFLFVVAAGSNAAAVRAGIMACLALYARGTARTYDALRGLAAAVFLMLLMNPPLLAFDPGFQLSLAATLGLMLGTPLIEPWLVWIRGAPLRELVSTTLAAQLYVLPLLLYQTGMLSWVAVPANVIVSPFMPAAMAAAAIAGTVSFLLPGPLGFLAPVAGLPAYALLAGIVAVARWSATLPFASFTIPAFPFALAVLAYALLGWLSYRYRPGATRPPPR